MKFFQCLIFVAFLHRNVCVVCDKSYKKYNITINNFENPLSKIMRNITNDFYSVRSHQVIITRSAENDKSKIIQAGIVNDALYRIDDGILIRLEGCSKKYFKTLRYYNIFFVDSYQSFRQILNGNSDKTFDFSGYYTVVLTNVQKNYTDIITRILKDCWELYIVNVNVVSYDPYNRERAFVHTYFPYTPEHCNQVKPVITGVFTDNTFVQNATIFPSKVDNFHKCNLTIGTLDFEPYVMITSLDNGSHYLNGFEGFIVRALSKRLNFSTIIKTHRELWGIVNGANSTGLYGMLYRSEVNFTIGAFPSSDAFDGSVSSTIAYFITPLILTIPPGRPYSAMEKLFFPFQLSFWICLSACFIVSAVIVSITKFIKPQKRAFIIGQGNSIPFNNTINIFLGGALSMTPSRNFARFLMMLWVLISIVLRGSYQGALFRFLKSQNNVSIVDTLPKMIEEDFKIYGDEGVAMYFTSQSLYGSMFTLIDAADIDTYRLKTLDQDFKGALVDTALTVSYLNDKYATKKIRFVVSKYEVVQFYIAIIMRQHSYLKDPFNRELWRYLEHGLIHHWYSLYLNPKNLKTVSDRSAPKALNLSELSGVFTIYQILIGFSLLVFVLEVLSTKSRYLRRIFNFLN
uniref:Uncharacterized protein n=1 Tax=Phlebotomus papatasi TaxID=29031 RepID=A0A3F2ZEH4_PHLPP